MIHKKYKKEYRKKDGYKGFEGVSREVGGLVRLIYHNKRPRRLGVIERTAKYSDNKFEIIDKLVYEFVHEASE